MPKLHPGQRKVLDSPGRFKVVACGRRWGKTLLGSCICVAKALQGGAIWWVAPDFPRARVGWRMMNRLAEQIPGCTINKGEAMIETPGGGWVQIKSAVNPDSLRGEGLDYVVIDECADVHESAWGDALRPALSDRRGGALFIGTPKGRNHFHALWARGRQNDGVWESFQMPTHTNPYIHRDELTQAELDMAARSWRQEYLAEFVTFEGRVYQTFDPEGPMIFRDLDRSRYTGYWGGIDFGFRNPTAIVVAGEDRDHGLDIIDEHYQTRLKTEQVITLVRDLQRRYNVKQWWADSADPQAIANLQDAGLRVEAAPRGVGGASETITQYEIRLVAAMLETDPVALRFYAPNAIECIREHDIYRYPKVNKNAREGEGPLKVDDHTCNAVQYLVHGLAGWYGFGESGMLGGHREAYSLPT